MSDKCQPIAETKTAEVVVFGEVLFDRFPERQVLGGAPFNVAWALTGFGVAPVLLSSVGKDRLGEDISDAMSGWGMSLGGLSARCDLPTGRVQVAFEADEPKYTIEEPSAWDRINTTACEASKMLYHGSLALRQESNQESLRHLIERSRGERFFDVNLRPPYADLELVREWLAGADWVKLNLDELLQILRVSETSFSDAGELVDDFLREFEIGTVILTAGSAGAMIRGRAGNCALSQAPAVENFRDAVGAGDAFSAVVIFGVLQSWEAEEILEKASQFASSVCALNGAISKDRSFYRLS